MGRLTLGFVLVVILVIGAVAASTPWWSNVGGDGRAIDVTAVASDSVDSPRGSSYYLLNVNATNLGAVSWGLDPGQFTLVSNSSNSYSPQANYNGTKVLGNSVVEVGRWVGGVVAFLLPADQLPRSLSYFEGDGVRLEAGSIPAVTSVASKLPYNVKLTLNGEGVEGWTVSNVPQPNMEWLRSLIANGVVENNTRVFFTGQVVKVNVWLEYLKKPADPVSINLVSASVGNGFEQIGPAVGAPSLMTGWGSQIGVVILARVPGGTSPGPLSVNIEFSS